MTETRGFLVDSNVLLDIFTRDPEWHDWSSAALANAARTSTVSINPLIFAEVSASFAHIDELEAAMPATALKRIALPYAAAFLAGKAFLAYRRRGGPRRAPLPDFYIGAHALVHGLTLITRDPKLYRTYFPTLKLITP